MSNLKEAVEDLLLDFKRHKVHSTNDVEANTWQQAVEELEGVLRNNCEDYIERYDCGCPVGEFGCQGYHGV